ncbi:MAG: hypothetical protein RLZZ142_259 [Verrucomicrobiota bacterium]
MEFAGGFEGIDAVEAIEEGERLADFVALEVPDEMPAGTLWQEGDFGASLLHAVFAEDGDSGLDCFVEGFRGVGLGYGDELDVLRGAA